MSRTYESPYRSQNPLAGVLSRLKVADHISFLRQFACNPRQTGAIAPSSINLAQAMTGDMGLEHASTVIELGAGTGAFTSVIAKRIPASARFLAFELNPRLAGSLQSKVSENVQVICDSAARLTRHLEDDSDSTVDAVISGLPWASLPVASHKSILLEVHRSLRPGGRFATFAYAHAAWLPNALRFRGKLELLFDHVEVSRIIWRNLPPAFIYRCRK